MTMAREKVAVASRTSKVALGSGIDEIAKYLRKYIKCKIVFTLKTADWVDGFILYEDEDIEDKQGNLFLWARKHKWIIEKMKLSFTELGILEAFVTLSTYEALDEKVKNYGTIAKMKDEPYHLV